MNINELETLNDEELLELEAKVVKDIRKVEESKFVFDPYHNGGKTLQQRTFYEKQNKELIKLNRFRKAINAELDKRTNPLKKETTTTTTTTTSKAAPNPFKVIASAIKPVEPKIVYKAPVEEQYMLAHAFMTVAQKGLPPSHYSRLLSLAVDRRSLETKRPMALAHSLSEN